jgi:hypothetical protein
MHLYSNYIIIGILVIIAAISKAICDIISFHYDSSVFKNLNQNWWNPLMSWKNKYEWFPKSISLTWLFSNPLVLFTDAWHFFGFLERIALFICLAFPITWYYIPVYYILFGLIFNLFFDKIFTK